MKPKSNYKTVSSESNIIDRCETPLYALDPILPFLNEQMLVWESACGSGRLVDALYNIGIPVVGTDINLDRVIGPLSYYDFFGSAMAESAVQCDYSIQVTNPPYGIKYEWLQRSYELNIPFALLMPVETIGAAKAQRLFQKYGIQIIYMDKRINFRMPRSEDYLDFRSFEPIHKPKSEAVFSNGLGIVPSDRAGFYNIVEENQGYTVILNINSSNIPKAWKELDELSQRLNFRWSDFQNGEVPRQLRKEIGSGLGDIVGYLGSAQFPTAWFCWKMNLPQDILFAKINKVKDRDWTPGWDCYSDYNFKPHQHLKLDGHTVYVLN